LQITATLAQGQSAGTEANSTTDEQGSGSLVSRFYQIPLDLYTNGSDNEGVDILHTLLNQASWTQVATANTGSSNFKVTV
jgi:hypothetical protein